MDNTGTPSKRTRPRCQDTRTTTTFQVSDELWAVLEPLLLVPVKTHRFGGERPRGANRDGADAIFDVLRTGCQWNAWKQTTLGAKSTAHDRFQEWVTDGVFLRLWQTGVEQFDDLGGIHGEWLSRDGAITKAPLGGEKNRANPTDQGKQGVKRHVLTEGHGVPLSIVVDGANRHDLKLTRRTWEGLVIERPEPADAPPQNVCLDQGYDDEVRDLLPAFGFTAHLRTHGEDAQALREEASQKARRWVVERAHSEMNRFRRLLVRWDNKPKNYLAFLHFVCRLIAFPATGLFG